MILNAHSYYSLRYGTLSIEQLVLAGIEKGHEALALTDINNSTGALEFVKVCTEHGIKPIVGMEFRNGDQLEYVALARNATGFREINEIQTERNLSNAILPNRPELDNCYIIYPYAKKDFILKENEFIGITPKEINRARFDLNRKKYVILKSVTFDSGGFLTHKKLRAVDHNLLLSQIQPQHTSQSDEIFIGSKELCEIYDSIPEAIWNTHKIISDCNFTFDFETVKNKKTFTGSHADDKALLEKLAIDGLLFRYGKNNREAFKRVKKELEIIDQLGFSSYFLITWDIIRYAMSRGFYHVGRGSGANSVVAYCLRITDVCPIELNLYFERFLNFKRKTPPDFDIDFSHRERKEIIDYIFKRYRHKHTALLGAMSTFKDRSILREIGKVHGLPKNEIDFLVLNPNSIRNKNEIAQEVLSIYKSIEDFPNARTIHAGGILISEEPLTSYSALDLFPVGFPSVQYDMYQAEYIHIEKLDILSQRGIGHIKESAEIVERNQGIKVNVFDFEKFKKDEKVKQQLKSGDTIGCFYIESPAMRGLLKKLHCETYLSLVAASSIIRPGVARSGMMKEYISRFHNPTGFKYLHPVMEEQLSETFGVMVFQEDVLKVGHYFGGLDLTDADVLRRMMSGKSRNKKHLLEIEHKFFSHCQQKGYPEHISKEVWRQIESFAGYSFSKAHSASYAVESYQSLYLKTYYPVEFMVAVINNFGGFYSTWVYVNEARKAGGNIHLPCVNKSTYFTTLYSKEIYLGFVHIKDLEQKFAERIEEVRQQGGEFLGLNDFVSRTSITLDQLIILIRINAFRFTRKNKRQLLWDAHIIFHKRKDSDSAPLLFSIDPKPFNLPKVDENPIENFYDEVEILEFPVTKSYFDVLKTKQRCDGSAKNLLQHVGETIHIMGTYVTNKHVMTVRGESMAFGTFLDENGDFFDTTHFPPCFREYPFRGKGVYLILGKVVEEFGFPSIEVEKMAKLPIVADPRTETEEQSKTQKPVPVRAIPERALPAENDQQPDKGAQPAA